jgi:transglutaminase-like putative cysteine protease
MQISVVHTTEYRYSAPVYLEPHVIRLRPREDGSQRTLAVSLVIEPAPASRSQCLDQDGNVVTHVWFAQPTERLLVRNTVEVQTLRENPFDFLVHGGDHNLPVRYPEPARRTLEPYLGAEADASVREFSESLAHQAGGRTMDFLGLLNRTLLDRVRQVVRPEGMPRSPEETLASGEGSCRDLALLFCAACRTMGVAARFVSGYEYQSVPSERGSELHAWAEVYLNGGGWRGYDPSRGLAVSTSHIPLAASANPEMAAPVSGTFRGSASASINCSISMQLK